MIRNKDMVPANLVRLLNNQFGQSKCMGYPVQKTTIPHYFLHRTFLDENDLLIIFNTKRCQYECHFCTLPYYSPNEFITGDDILTQFKYVLSEMKHSLSVLERLTVSNNGSILDKDTFPHETLIEIATGSYQLKGLQTLVIETRLEFVKPQVIDKIHKANNRIQIDILTGFETYNINIRDKILVKHETLKVFEKGLDKVAQSEATLSSYILYKPSPYMSDEEAFIEADRSINYLVEQCESRNINLNYIRLNPMYAAKGSKWAEIAKKTPEYRPPLLTDVMRLAEKKTKEGIKIYIGLSTEGLDEKGFTYHSREDYFSSLIKSIKLFNDRKILSFKDVIKE